MSDYPECEKLKAVSDKSQVVGEFLEWLQYEKEFMIAKHVENEDEDGADYLAPMHINTERLLAEFFDIDMDKVETERRAMLESIRN